MIKKNSICLLTLSVFILVYLGTAYYWAHQTSKIALNNYDLRNLSEIQLTKSQIEKLLKIEDPSFWVNNGIDIFHDGQGKTTMTQSIVPILLYSTELKGWKSTLQKLYSSLWPKLKKIDLGRDVMALAVSKKISKDKILKIFTEQVYLGRLNNISVIGLSSAAQKYFNKEISMLDPEEFAGLIGMLKSPDHYNPIKNRAAFDDRKNRILKVLDGRCIPKGLFDTNYNHCT